MTSGYSKKTEQNQNKQEKSDKTRRLRATVTWTAAAEASSEIFDVHTIPSHIYLFEEYRV